MGGKSLRMLVHFCTLYSLVLGTIGNPVDRTSYEVFVLDDGSGTLFPNQTACLFSFFPCSAMIIGNLILVLFYGAILALAAKMISDGAELLLDLGLPSGLIGGVVLPLLGAVPDTAMIIFSGIGGSKEEVNKQISVGMGTLAGSTIMLLTLPWLGSLILGRLDIVNGVGVDQTTRKFSIKSFVNQGVTVFPDVTFSAVIMLITTLPYFIVQGADWHFGPSRTVQITDASSGQPNYIKYSALATSILAFLFLIAYLVFQVIFSMNSQRKNAARIEAVRQELIKRRVLKSFLRSAMTKVSVQSVVPAKEGEAAPLLDKDKKWVAKMWRTHRAPAKQDPDAGNGEEQAKVKKDDPDHKPKRKICLKSLFLLIFGVVVVTIISDPMVDTLTSLTDPDHSNYYLESSGKKGQHIPIPVFYLSFVVTPICSNASELLSSLVFASKRKIVTTSMTYSQLYGAVTMNNTLCLAVFAALVFFNDLDWQFSAEVTVILVIEFAVGMLAIITGFGYKHTYLVIMGVFVGALYFLSIFLVAMLENFAHWK